MWIKSGLFIEKISQIEKDYLNLESLSQNQKGKDYKISKKNLGNINENEVFLIQNFCNTEKGEI